MSKRYVTQRDPDGTWSVRDCDTNATAVLAGVLLAGMSEQRAVAAIRNFGMLGLADYHSPLPRERVDNDVTSEAVSGTSLLKFDLSDFD
jgi:hypothetical protein